MKILMISDVYFPRVNGVSTSIATFRREFEAMGHEVHLIAPDYGKTTADERNIHRIPSRYLPLDPEDRMMKAAPVRALLSRLREMKFDLVHIHTPFVAHYLGVRLAKALGVPRVETYHTFFEEYLYYYVPFLPKPLMRFLARRFSSHQCNDLDGLAVPSGEMLRRLREYGIRAAAEVIPTGLEAESFELGDGEAFRAQYGIAPGQAVLVYIGRVAFEKNIAFLLRVTALLKPRFPDLVLLIAGEGPALHSLKRQAAELGIAGNVRFVGYLDRKRELPHCYRAGDVFVFASRTETQGLVLLEAMAQRVPVVSLAEMGVKDVLQHGKGVLIAEAEEDFAAKVNRLLEDRSVAKLLGELGGQYAAAWSAAALAEKMLDFYRQAIESYARRHAPAAARGKLGACLSED
ncbi:MAG: glycosyltransferase [Sulfuricellaceae bacterium]|jgi:1,2-diacylglycerol 3-alpha-glucosyltransferase